MSTSSFVLKRLADDWKLLVAIFAGVTIAATLLAGAPVYMWTLERQGINTAIDRSDPSFLNIFAISPYIDLTRSELDRTNQGFADSIADNIQTIYRGRERYLKSPTFLVGTDRKPLAGAATVTEEPSRASRGYFQHISNLEHHVTFQSGRMSTDEVLRDGPSPVLEAIIGTPSASIFDIEVGDEVEMTPSLSDDTRLIVRIVGVMEPTDPTEEYWQLNPNIFIDPAPLEELPDIGVEVDPEEPPLAVFLTREALIEGVGESYPGTLVNSNWFVFIDKEMLKTWEKDEARARLAQLETDVSLLMPGSAVFTGITTLLNRFERRSFFTGVPLLLLLVIMTITVLYYILMMVSYLVTAREADVALLRSRGVTAWHLTRIYALEGFAISVIAVAIAPFLAMGAIASAGKVGYFEDITLGRYLPVSLAWTPFLVAAGAGLICVAIYVVPAVVGARTGLIAHRLRSSRPPSTPFFQRYYVDIGLMAIGGLVFWELFSRGQVVSGGLFGGAHVNEALLFAPVLLLTVVALLFMRFFPLIVRFLSGESPALMHLIAGGASSVLALIIVVSELRLAISLEWLPRVAVLAALLLVYYVTWKASRRNLMGPGFVVGLVLQAVLIGLFIYSDVPTRDAIAFIPTVVLALLVPLQLFYVILRRLARTYPVWASMAIWRMARNPLQYSWLVLLVVMVTGLAVLTTTVGGTLDRSYEERILYEVASDVRVTGVRARMSRGIDAVKESYLMIPGVTSVSLALRGLGSVGATYSGNTFSILAVESDEFPYVSWYRDDFSERPLPYVMSLLRTGSNLPRIQLPKGAENLYVWAHPVEEYPNLFLWMVLEDSRGVTNTVTFGPVSSVEWSMMEANVPRNLIEPMNLISVQIYQPAFGPAGTAGTILLDDIQVSLEGRDERFVLDDFEGPNKWTPLSTSMISRDLIGATRQNVKNGKRSGVFVFGKDTDRGIRGFYRSPTGGPVPVVASATFLRRTGINTGDTIIANVFGRLIPVRVMDTVEYFPTLNPTGNGFLVADLDNLLQHLNILSPIGAIGPNELLLAEIPGSEEQVYRAAASLVAQSNQVLDKTRMLESVRLDPLITAGWRVMMLVAVFIIIFVASLGYITYLLSFSGDNRLEMGFLQALGIRSRQMTLLLSAEHLTIAAMGLTIGTAAGFTMSSIMVSSVAITEQGGPVIPPYILTTDWAFMGPIYGVLAVIFVGALLWLSRSVTRASLHEMTRLEGD